MTRKQEEEETEEMPEQGVFPPEEETEELAFPPEPAEGHDVLASVLARLSWLEECMRLMIQKVVG